MYKTFIKLNGDYVKGKMLNFYKHIVSKVFEAFLNCINFDIKKKYLAWKGKLVIKLLLFLYYNLGNFRAPTTN